MSENKNFKKEDDNHSAKKAEESEEQNEREHNSASAQEDVYVDAVDSDDYFRSYNYFLYYNSIKPIDPRLPKPLYRSNNNYLKDFF